MSTDISNFSKFENTKQQLKIQHNMINPGENYPFIIWTKTVFYYVDIVLHWEL